MVIFHDPNSNQPTGKQTIPPNAQVFPTCGVLAAVVKKNVSDTADHPSAVPGEEESRGFCSRWLKNTMMVKYMFRTEKIGRFSQLPIISHVISVCAYICTDAS